MFKSKSPAPAATEPTTQIPQPVTYRNSSGWEIVPTDTPPLTIYTTSDVDNLWPGKTVTGTDGSKATVMEIRHVSGRLYRVVLLPLPEVQQ